MATGRLEFRILGPLKVLADGEPVSIGGPKQRALLALLLLSSNRVVSRDRLLGELFVEVSPNSADHALRNQISRLRKVLSATGADPPRLVARPPGYLLRVEPGELDFEDFERLWVEGREALAGSRPAVAARALRAALALWSGRALADVELEAFGQVEVERLEEFRLAAVEQLVDADLALGRHLELVSELEALAAEYPYRERFRAQLMLALYRCGRQAEGLEVYRQTRALFTEELGLVPGVELQELERAILVQEPELQPPANDGGALLPPQPATRVCPFKGLAPFEPHDHDLFFGRERLVGELIARLETTNFLLLTGPSGSGKSSVLQAGLLPSLDGRCVVVRPGSRPTVELIRALGDEPSVALDRLAPGERLVLAVDQLEEAFAADVDPVERAAFFASLVDAAWDAERRAVILLALRGDFFGRLGSYVELADLVGSNHVLLGPMSPAELRRAIEGPAECVGLSVEPALVDVLVQEVAGELGGLPLLSAALVDVWRERSRSSLTLEAYERTGGVRGAVARHAEAALRTLGDDEQLIAKRIVLRLVAGGDGEALTRRRATLAELDADDPQIARVLAALVEMRLLVAGDDSVELVHDALFEQWPRLTEWLKDDAEGRRVHQHLAQAAVSWDEAGRVSSDLYRGTRLAAALEWTGEARAASRLNQLEREFLEQGQQAFVREAEGQRRANRRLRGLFGIAVLLLVAAATAGAIVLVERAHAQQQAIAAVAESLGAQALVQPRPDTSLLLAREGVNLDDSPETRSNLLAALLRSPDLIGVAHTEAGPVFDDALSPEGRLLAYRDRDGAVYLVNTSSLRRLVRPFYAGSDLDVLDAIGRPLTDLAFSPDGRTLAIGSTDSALGGPTQAVIFLYDIRSHRHRLLESSGLGNGGTADVLFAPDGRTLVAGRINSGKEVVFLLRVSDEQPLARSQRIPAGRVIGFVNGGRELLVTSGASRSLLLDAHTLRSVRTLHEGGAAAVSRDGDLAAFGGANGTIVLVDLRTGERTTMQGRASAAIESLAFSPDGKMLASTAANGSVAVWDVPTATLREAFAGHTTSAFDPVFSPNGETLYAGSADGTVLAWDVGGRRSLGTTFRFAAASVAAATAVAVSPDSSRFATSPAPDRITIWRSRDEMVVGKLRGAVGSVKSLAFSHDGRFLAAVGTSPSIVIWNIHRRRIVRVLRQPGPPAVAWEARSSAVAFAPNDRLVASAANDGLQVFSWPSRRFLGPETSVGRAPDLAFSADSRLLASAGPTDGELVVWHLQRSADEDVYTYDTIGTPFDSLEFAPQGTTIAAGDGLGNVNFFNAATGRRLPQQLAGQNGAVLSLSFDPTGHRLMTTSSDGKIRLWNLATEKLIGTPLPGSTSRGQGTFFPNGKRLIAVFPSGTGIIWNVDPASWNARACKVAGHNLSRTEWRSLHTNVPYHKVCA
jgi:WD40 repeat protein/DNA-binding SARP family transcriptional activator/energy-coupling factor transporter ATP-binding protein EcfA2